MLTNSDTCLRAHTNSKPNKQHQPTHTHFHTHTQNLYRKRLHIHRSNASQAFCHCRMFPPTLPTYVHTRQTDRSWTDSQRKRGREGGREMREGERARKREPEKCSHKDRWQAHSQTEKDRYAHIQSSTVHFIHSWFCVGLCKYEIIGQNVRFQVVCFVWCTSGVAHSRP